MTTSTTPEALFTEIYGIAYDENQTTHRIAVDTISRYNYLQKEIARGMRNIAANANRVAENLETDLGIIQPDTDLTSDARKIADYALQVRVCSDQLASFRSLIAA